MTQLQLHFFLRGAKIPVLTFECGSVFRDQPQRGRAAGGGLGPAQAQEGEAAQETENINKGIPEINETILYDWSRLTLVSQIH